MDLRNVNTIEYHGAVLEGIEVLCRIFWGPDMETCRRMIKKDFFTPFEIIQSDQKDESGIFLNDIQSIPDRFETCESLHGHLDECYINLFINNRDGIIPLYQSCYEFENAPMMGASAQKMSGLFESRGLSLGNNFNEPPDHIAIELEYLFFLLQEAWDSRNENEPIPAEVRCFASENMLPWVMDFCRRLESVPVECRFYLFASRMLVMLLEAISKLSLT